MKDENPQYVQAHENKVHARFDALLERMAKVNAKYSDEQVERDINQVSRVVRARRRARSKKQGDYQQRGNF